MPGGRGRHRGVLLRSGNVLVTGGTSGPTFSAGYRSAIIYHPATDTWSTTGSLATGRWAHVAVELADGRVLAAGGVTRSGAAAPSPDTAVLASAAEAFTP
jgi:hypothetical protein